MTNSSAPVLHPRINDYLGRLDTAVGSLPHAEAADIVREIHVHIDDALAADRSDAAVQRVLASLGSPEALAESYRMELLLTRAGRSFSPWFLLRTTGRWALSGAKGFAAFMIGLVGYGIGLAFTITLLMKPFVPSVGVWVGRDTLQVGTPSNPAAMHEVLGHAYVPVITVLAFAAVVGTTHALRWLIRKRAPNGHEVIGMKV
jgi:HAAS domain-containing protein